MPLILEQTLIHISFTVRLNLELGMRIIRLHLVEILKDETVGASERFLSFFKFIYFSIKDLRMLN